MVKKNPGGNQANTKGPKSSYSSAPMSSPVPTMRPDNFDSIVAAQMGGGDSNRGNFSPPVSPSGNTGGNSGGFFANFNPLNFGLIGIARALFNREDEGRGPTARDVPQQRPSIRQQDGQLIATRDMPRFGFSAGDSAPVPDFGPFSIRNFTNNEPGTVMRNIMGAERQMSPSPLDRDGDQTQPTIPVASQNTMPSAKPAWWPSYLPWPPTPDSYARELASSGYSSSISASPNAISNTQNPLMMGIGGMLRRP